MVLNISFNVPTTVQQDHNNVLIFDYFLCVKYTTFYDFVFDFIGYN